MTRTRLSVVRGFGQAVSTSPEQPQFRAVKLPRRSINLSAGIEDRRTGEVIRVANASMAIRVAKLMNDEAEGKPSPERAAQHTPIRFQLTHDASAPTPGAGVLYVHRMAVRLVGWCASEERARQVARLLARVDYPMDERRGLARVFSAPKAHDFGDTLRDLPEPGTRPLSARRYRTRVLGLAL